MRDNSEWPSREAIAGAKTTIAFLVVVITVALVIAGLAWLARSFGR
jgi:preprotein translocase subunit SecE